MSAWDGNRLVLTVTALALLLFAGCGPDRTRTRPTRSTVFQSLSYRSAQERYRQRMEERYERRDRSYLISVLDYGLASYYARDRQAARQSFTAAYRVDDGDIPEAAKFFNWLQEDSRRVYRLDKRERLLVHFYLGLNYLFDDNIEAALVEFKKLRLRDMDASSLPVVNFYYGLVCELAGEYDNALIEYRALAEMLDESSSGLLAPAGLIARVESVAAGRAVISDDSLELIIQIDHLFIGSSGPTEVWADGQSVAKLPEAVDLFDVRLTGDEIARKAAQDATAAATREGLRFLSKALSRMIFNDTRPGELVTDITFGGREQKEDDRYWGYAPVAFSFGRVRVPAGTREVRLEFNRPGGSPLGSCRYPLDGEHARVERTGRSVFISAGLAEEFYEY